MYHKYVKVLLVFTFDYSLETWETSGTLEKELKPYKLLNELKNIEFIFVTYGDKNDKSIETKIKNLKSKMIENIARLCEISKNQINIKGKTTEKLGVVGKEKAIACEVICSVIKYD